MLLHIVLAKLLVVPNQIIVLRVKYPQYFETKIIFQSSSKAYT